ncbi:MAG: MBL fold metallo-hydrolase [Spirochaetales bacterium]|nr:MBL fold metallo-hydrolase [Spirochaetales bacterium]
MKRHPVIIAAALLLAAVLVCAVSCHSLSSAPKGPDKDGSYTSSVYYTGDDAGKLTVRYIGLSGADGDTYAGDCAVYTSPEGLVMMVDCGNQISYQELFPVLDAMGIRKIDIFVMSHPHVDHIGSFTELARRYGIGKLYKNYVEYRTDVYKGAMMTAEQLGIEVQVLYEGDSFKFGEYVDVQVFWPYEGQVIDQTDAASTNHSSLAMRITYGDSSFWSSGDLYLADEMELVKRYGEQIRSDVVKMNHHGRETSNSKDYINTLQPKIAVACQSHFSSEAVLNWYRGSGATVFHTAFDGTVRISTAGDGHYDVQVQNIRTKTKLYGKPAEDGHYVF